MIRLSSASLGRGGCSEVTSVFCPNCGTQNPDTATTCTKCGFNLKGAAAPKFKGTMLMMNPGGAPAPGAAPGAPAPAEPVAPPPPAPAAPAADVKAKLKGTMIGVAPPAPGAAPAPTVDPMAGTMMAPPGASEPFPPPAAPGFAPPTPGAFPPPDAGFPPPGGGFPGAPMGGAPMGGAPMGGPMGAPPMGGGAAYGAPPADLAPAGFGGPPVAASGGALAAFGPIGAQRNPMMEQVYFFICFLFGLFRVMGMLGELNAFRRKSDINPIFIVIPFLNLLTILGLPDKVYEAKVLAGIPNPTKPNLILWLLLGGFIPFFLSGELNEIYAAAAKRQG